jgi:acyl-CoA thioesterase I
MKNALLGMFAAAMMMMSAWAAGAAPVILVYGDSLSAEYGLARGAGWAARLAERLQQERLDYSVVNASISGETTAGGASRIEAALATHRPALVIVELGGNDGLRGLSLAASQSNLDRIIAAARKSGVRVVLCGMRLPPNYGRDYTAKFHAMYADLARLHKAALVPFFLEGVAEQRDLFQADGIHPTAAAQPRILDNVWVVLGPMLKPARKAG